MFFKTHEPVKKLTTSELKEFPKLRKTNFRIFLHRTVSWKNCLWASLWKERWYSERVSDFCEKSFHWYCYIHAAKISTVQQTAHLTYWTWSKGHGALLWVCLLQVIIGIFPTIVTELWLKESYMCEISYIQLDGKLPPTQTDKDLTVWL